MYKPLQTEWESFFFPSRRPRPSPFWRGILQLPSYALRLWWYGYLVSFHITVTKHECHGLWNHRQIDCLLSCLLGSHFLFYTNSCWSCGVAGDITELRLSRDWIVNSLSLNRRPFADDIFECIFLNENVWISIKISSKFFLRVQLTIFQHWFR